MMLNGVADRRGSSSVKAQPPTSHRLSGVTIFSARRMTLLMLSTFCLSVCHTQDLTETVCDTNMWFLPYDTKYSDHSGFFSVVKLMVVSSSFTPNEGVKIRVHSCRRLKFRPIRRHNSETVRDRTSVIYYMRL